MSARKKETEFNEYFHGLWEHARSRKMSKGEFMNASGLSPQRFSEFSHGIRNVTGEYFLKMIAGLALTPDDVEQISGKSFTDEQLLQIRFDSFVRSQRPFLEELMRDPLKLQAAKMAIRFERLWQRHIVKRFGKRLLKGRQS